MNEIARSDIFFLITSASVIILTVVFVILLVYVIKVARNVKKITDVAGEEIEHLAEDMRKVRSDVREGTSTVKNFLKVVAASFGVSRTVNSIKKKIRRKPSIKQKKKVETKGVKDI
jgi:predicted Holliday junction resolvase-like endonuclease